MTQSFVLPSVTGDLTVYCRSWTKDTLLNSVSQPTADACPSDVPYFESYAHYSIHEEMLKVCAIVVFTLQQICGYNLSSLL